MKLAITVCATESYCYAIKTLARRVAACLAYAEWTEPGMMIVAGDNTRRVKDGAAHFKAMLPKNWEIVHLDASKENLAEQNYKVPAQIIIAQLRTAAFSHARSVQTDLCWSLDSDTLPPANALQCMLDGLKWDRGYYSISTCPYPNEAFLGGRGTQFNPIAEDFLETERTIPAELQTELDAIKSDIAALTKEATEAKVTEPTKEWIDQQKAVETRREAAAKKVKECPPLGNIFALNAKNWRQRGWLDNAYPALGRGAMVPSDWCGFGCTLMNRAALALADFDGYEGHGTEDLFVVWHRWWPAKLRINVITHCPCDHVIWAKKKGGDEKEYTLIRSYHEEHGECVGHLRTRKTAWKEF